MTISSSLFGTTFYSLVGLHAFHVLVGLTGLSIIMIFTALGFVKQEHAERIGVFAHVLALCRCHLGGGAVRLCISSRAE